MHPTYDSALRIVGALTSAMEVPITDTGIMMIPAGHKGPVKGYIEGSAPQQDIMLADFDASSGAIELFDLGLKSTGQARLTTIYDEKAAGGKPAIILRAPDGVQSHAVRDGIKDAVREIGTGWQRDGGDMIKVFSVNDPQDSRNIAEDRQGQRGVIDGILNDDDMAKPNAVRVTFLDADGKALTQDEASDWSRVKNIALRITQQQAGLVNAELGTSIGIQK